MNSIESILGMIRTDAVMYGTTEEQWIRDESITPERSREPDREYSPSVNYHLELVRHKDGTYEWVE